MKNLAFLEYMFMFDPSETWSNLYQFEDSLVMCFGQLGYEAEIVKTAGGQFGKRVLLISKIGGIPGTKTTSIKEKPKAEPKAESKPQSFKHTIDSLRNPEPGRYV